MKDDFVLKKVYSWRTSAIHWIQCSRLLIVCQWLGIEVCIVDLSVFFVSGCVTVWLQHTPRKLPSGVGHNWWWNLVSKNPAWRCKDREVTSPTLINPAGLCWQLVCRGIEIVYVCVCVCIRERYSRQNRERHFEVVHCVPEGPGEDFCFPGWSKSGTAAVMRNLRS